MLDWTSCKICYPLEIKLLLLLLLLIGHLHSLNLQFSAVTMRIGIDFLLGIKRPLSQDLFLSFFENGDLLG